MPRVGLPTLKLRAGIVTARSVAAGEIAHCRFQFTPEDTRHCIAPAVIARAWQEHGVTEMPRTVLTGRQSLDQSQIGPMVGVRLRFGLEETVNFLVLPEKAEEWWGTAKRFEKLYDDYQKMMKGG